MAKQKQPKARRITEAQVRAAGRRIKREHRRAVATWCRENVHRFETSAEMIAEARQVFEREIRAVDWDKVFDFLVKLITFLMSLFGA